MRHAILLALLGCGGAAPPPAIANAATVRRPITLDGTWETLANASIAAAAPVGPFDDLKALCARLGHPGSCQIVITTSDGDTAPFRAVGEVHMWDGPQTDRAPRRVDVIFRVEDQWYVLPRFAQLTNGAGRFALTTERADRLLLLRYEAVQVTPRRARMDAEAGVVACKLVGAAPACTPKVVVRRERTRGETSVMELACQLTADDDALVVAPLPAGAADWTKTAAAACEQLPYVGRRPVKFE